MKPSARATGRRHLYALVALVGAIALGACRGENLFSLAGSVSGSEPSVEITAPTGGSTTFLGDSILVLASIEAPDGVVTVDFRATYTDSIGGDAYNPETLNGANALSLSVTNRLTAVTGQRAGEAYIVVLATDVAGQQGIDSVKVVIGS
jgi:hypothetical protein